MDNTRRNNRFVVLALVSAIGLIIIMCAVQSPLSWSDSGDTPSQIRISGSSWVHDAPTRVAQLQGYFNGAGPVIEVSYQASGRASMDQLLAREVDYALVAATPLAQALLNQGPETGPDDLVVLAVVSLSNQTHHVLAVEERGIYQPGDLVGRKVGVLGDSSAEYYWSLFSIIYGLQGLTELVYMPLESMRDALHRGDVDAVVTWDPWIHRIERDLGLTTRRFSQRQIYTLNWLLVSHRDTVDRYPAVADRILSGYLRAVKTMIERPELSRELQIADADLPADYLGSLEGKIIYHPGLQWSVLIDIEQQLDWFIARHDAAEIHRPGPDRYLAPGPISRVAPHRLLVLNVWANPDAAGGTAP